MKTTSSSANVTVLPADVSSPVPAGDTLLDAGERAGVEMEAGCFNCSCGTCVVEVVKGMDHLEPPSPEELEVLDQWNRDSEKFRLACCTRVKGTGDVVLRQIH